MDKNRLNIILLEKDWGLFFGNFENNLAHQHYAIQITIPLTTAISNQADKLEINSYEPVLIPSNLKHKIRSRAPFLILLINPITLITEHQNIVIYSNDWINKVKEVGLDLFRGNMNVEDFSQEVRKEMSAMFKSSSVLMDSRIKKAIEYLRKHEDRNVSLSEISQLCFLSESRFLHLFKSEMGMSYRRTQLWYRVSQSLLLLQEKSVTHVAYEYGFTDGSHYSKVFKETFGFSPKQFLQNSQFIQVL